MKRHESIREIDLLAYADGLLETDLARREEVERYLSKNAKAAAYVDEIRVQNEDLKALYGSVLYDPVPDQLSAVLRAATARPAGRKLAQVAAAVALLLASSWAGWLIGQNGQEDRLGPASFVERAAANHRTVVAGETAVSAVNGETVSQPLGWLNRRIALELTTPDLEAYGFSLVAKEKLGPESDPMVRLLYRRSDSTTINLFLRPRWEEASSRIGKAEADEVSVLYWLDGPLAFAMTTSSAGSETDDLGHVVRAAIGRARVNDGVPTMALSPDSGEPAQAIGDGMPGSLQPIRPDAPMIGGGHPDVQVN
ncbi:MAG: anti-sigma factor family protein [Kiloniellaceae bacterium]